MGGAMCATTTVFAVLLIGSKVVAFNVRNKHALAEIRETARRIRVMTNDQARQHLRDLAATTPHLLTFAATRPPDSTIPAPVAEFFSDWDRVDLCTKGNPSPYLSVCRELIGTVPNNPGAVKVGEIYTAGSCIAVSPHTGRVSCHAPPIRRAEVQRVAKVEALSHASLWHMLACLAESLRIGERHGFEPLPRVSAQDNRPSWRVAGAKD
jgi:hypothetical protein